MTDRSNNTNIAEGALEIIHIACQSANKSIGLLAIDKKQTDQMAIAICEVFQGIGLSGLSVQMDKDSLARTVTFPNGTVVKSFNTKTTERIRGENFSAIWSHNNTEFPAGRKDEGGLLTHGKLSLREGNKIHIETVS